MRKISIQRKKAVKENGLAPYFFKSAFAPIQKVPKKFEISSAPSYKIKKNVSGGLSSMENKDKNRNY